MRLLLRGLCFVGPFWGERSLLGDCSGFPVSAEVACLLVGALARFVFSASGREAFLGDGVLGCSGSCDVGRVDLEGEVDGRESARFGDAGR